ncbi:MAG: hypothetical protein HC844_17360 [Tabrizicola sp.]|nr:hypothetical protein [Tabrizicola sp.]
MRHFLFCLVLLPLPAFADEPLSGNQFDQNVTGRTITYDYGGGVSGTEEYLPDRKVRWAFEGDLCVYGIWYEQQGNEICFVYDNDPEAKCWYYYLRDGVIHGQYLGPGADNIVEVERTATPLPCAGPDVGV